MPGNSNRLGGRDIVNALFTYADMQQRAKALNQQGELANKDLKERMLGRKHREKIEKEAVPTAERTMSQEQLNESLKQVPKVHTPISSGEFAVMDAQIRNWSKANGMQMEKALAPFKNFAQNLTQTQGYTRYQTFKAAVENWDNLKVEPLKAIQKSLDNATELGDAKAIEKFAKMIDSFDAKPGETPEVLKGVFAASYQYDQDLKRKGALPPPKKFEESLASTYKDDPKKTEELYKGMVKGKGASKPTDFEKAYFQHNSRTKDNLSRADFRKKHWLSDPAIGQEMTSLRQDRRYLNREISTLNRKIAKAKKFPDIEMYQREAESAKEQIEAYNSELDDLKTRESELLGKKQVKYKSKEEVRAAYNKLPPDQKKKRKEEFARILMEQF